MLTIHLSGCDTAQTDTVKVIDKRSPICKLARKLIADHDMFEPVRVVRNGLPVFKTAPLWVFAMPTASEPPGQSVHLARYRSDPRFAGSA